MDRRDFLTIGGLGIAGLVLPIHGRAVAAEELLSTLDVSLKKAIADAALEAATKAGASYCDVRVGRYLRQFVLTRENRVENVVNTESTGIGVRVIVNGTWGFAATSDLTKDGAATAAAQAAAIARANSRAQTEPVQLAKVKGVGEVAWSTPIRKNAMAVPLKDKAELLLAVNAAALKAGASFISSNMFAINEQKYFASTDGSYIDQDIHRIWVPFTVTAVDQASGRFRTRDGLSAPMGMGYEYLDGDARAKFVMPNGVVNYGNSYDMVEDAIAAAQQAREKLKAPSVKTGKYDLVLDPSHLWLTIHESVGHPLELDRVLGYEANFAGTSFATLDKLKYGLRPMSDRGARPEMRLKDVFLAGSFVETLPANSSRYVTEMYEQARQAQQFWASYRDAVKFGDTARAAELMAENREQLVKARRLSGFTDAGGQLNEQVRRIEASRSLSPETKRKMIDALEQRRNQLAMRAVAP